MAEHAKQRGPSARAKQAVFDGTVEQKIKGRYESLNWAMDERMRRLWAGSEALVLGRGGVSRVAQATGLSRNVVAGGLRDLQQRERDRTPQAGARIRTRREGGGRRAAIEQQPGLKAALEALVDPVSRGDPTSPLRWTSKSLRHLSQQLKAQGYAASPPLAGRLLQEMKYSLQANRKTQEGTSHPDRDAQFQYVATQTQQALEQGQPVISIDTKKKELVGPFKNGGQEWEPQGRPVEVKVHDFGGPSPRKAIPYGVYDLGRNCGWVNVGVDHDTAEFAVESVRRWWKQMGQATYPNATQLVMTADAGGSNGYRTRLWKLRLQELADELGLSLTVCHFPPGTSKWNKIEHRMFSHITQNWRGRPLVSHEVIVNLIAATTTHAGLRIQAELDSGSYPKGLKVRDQQMAQLRIQPAQFHGEWNYTISPRIMRP